MIIRMTPARMPDITRAATILVVASVMGLLAFCQRVASADESTQRVRIINYQTQTDLFVAEQGTTPFLVKQANGNKSNPIVSTQSQLMATPSFMLMSLAPGSSKDASASLAMKTEQAASAPQLTSMTQPSIADLADTLQWTILLLTAVVAAVIGVHRFTKQRQKPHSSHRMEYQGCLPVRGQFSMHLVTIIDRQFLVTTDRSGVKTVNALSEWDQFTAPIDLSEDDQLTQFSVESKPRHHG